jgi:hypothetical protein
LLLNAKRAIWRTWYFQELWRLPDPKGHVRYYHHIASSVVCKSLTLTLEGCRRDVYSVPSERMGTLGIFLFGTLLFYYIFKKKNVLHSKIMISNTCWLALRIEVASAQKRHLCIYICTGAKIIHLILQY